MKTKIILCALIAMVSLSGCGIIKIVYHIVSSNDGDYITPEQEARILCEQMFDSVRNRDKEKLKSLFCKKLQETHDLDKEVDEFFDFIDGEIISYDEPDGYTGAGRTTAKDGIVVDEIMGEVRNIKTDTGKTYEIDFSSYRIYKDNENLLGIVILGIMDQDKFDIEGKLIEGFYYEISLY